MEFDLTYNTVYGFGAKNAIIDLEKAPSKQLREVQGLGHPKPCTPNPISEPYPTASTPIPN